LLTEEDIIKDVEAELLQKGLKIKEEYISKRETIRSKELREKYRYFLQLDLIEVFTYEGDLYKKTYSSEISEKPGIPPSILEKILKEKTPLSQIQPYQTKLLLRVFIPVETKKGVPYILAIGKLINPESIKGLPKKDKFLLKTINLFLILSFLMLLLLVVFLGIWIGNKLGKSLSEPLQNLVLATQKITQRDFDLSEILPTTSQEDEIAKLINSFKIMAKEIKNYEDTLKKYNEYLGGVLNSLPVGIIIFKSNLEVLFINAYLKEYLGQLELEDIQVLAERLSLKRFFQSLSLKETHYQVFFLESKGKEISLGITFMKLELFEDILLLLIIENLEEKETLKRLSLWREVAVKIAHEIKNPLTPIKLSIERLRKRIIHELSPENKELLEQTVKVIGKYVEELRKLALDFYYFSQRPYFEKIKFNLVENLEEVLELYKLAYPEINIKMEVKAEKEELNLLGDPFQFKRVWINLIENSIKAMQERGEIEIIFLKDGEKIVVYYEDKGEGMSEELIDAFNTGDFSKLQKIGTGLLIIRGVVELHKGRIWAENSLKGGTKFILELG
ncbi:MAG: sensor histidine kinase, partial [Caldimicrobium sp.]